jgi:MSHA biogenesis protein MshJ
MDDIKARLKVYADRIDAMSVRERGLIFFAVVVVLYLVAYSVVFAPLRTEQTRLEKQLRDKLAQAQQADQQVAALFSADGKDINAENRSKLAALSEQVRELDAKMDQMTAGVVPPKEMAKLVEQMLMRNKNPLDDAKTAADKPAPGVTVYRHGMRVEFKGRYFDIVNYLKSLEGLPWKVYWGEVSLETDKYPVSKVSLVIYTLSRYPGWIGV